LCYLEKVLEILCEVELVGSGYVRDRTLAVLDSVFVFRKYSYWKIRALTS